MTTVIPFSLCGVHSLQATNLVLFRTKKLVMMGKKAYSQQQAIARVSVLERRRMDKSKELKKLK
jgi:hypothetical protein